MKFKLILIVILVSISNITFAEAEVSDYLDLMKTSEAQAPLIEKLALSAKTKNIDEVLSIFDPLIIEGTGIDQVKSWLSSEVFPFFSPYEKMHTYKQTGNGQLPDGRIAQVHYVYFKDIKEKEYPFQVAFINTEEGPKIVNIIIEQCIKGRHPYC